MSARRLLLLLAVSLPLTQAQSPPFEVATVKLVEPRMGPHAVGLRFEHGTATLQAATVRQIIVQAYAVQRVLVLGGPTWYDDDQYDIVAKAPTPDATPAEIRSMLQNLLADRFHLSVHRTTRQLTVYSLTVGKNGAKLTAPLPDEPSNVGFDDTGAIIFKNAVLAGLVNTLANNLDLPVVDKTGLTGRYNFKINLSRDPAGPSLFTAIEEQLGLKLEQGKAPVEILQVDHVERPSAN